MSTFVAFGNARQPFTRLLLWLDAHADLLSPPVTVQCGHTPFAAARLHCVDFLDMEEFERRIREADLVIMQAGGGAVLQAVAAGKVPIVVPRRGTLGEHVDDHQVENGLALAASGKVLYAAQPEDIPAALQQLRSRPTAAVAAQESRLVAEIARLLQEHARTLEEQQS